MISKSRFLRFFRRLSAVFASFLLVFSSGVPVNAITLYELNSIANSETVFFGGSEHLSSYLCGSGATANYPIHTPEIRDPEAFANAIDEYIDERFPDSPFVGMGRYFVEGGMRAGINPILAVAIAQAESSLGTDPDTTAIELGGYNAFGRGATNSQPFVQLREDTIMWYAWESWEKSLVASSFPANGSSDEPDDFFQYIDRRFDGNLESGLRSFLVGGNGVPGYIDSEVDDVDRYIDTVTFVTNSIANIAEDAIDITRINPEGGVCIDAEGVVGTALLYAWPEYRSVQEYGAARREQKSEYADAHRAAAQRGEYLGGCNGNDCGAFVTRVMRDSGFDPNYNSSNGNTVYQRSYLEANWSVVGRGNQISTADLLPGDVAMRDGHTFMFVGDQPGFESVIASSSYSEGCRSATVRAPMAGREIVTDSRLTWYRNI